MNSPVVKCVLWLLLSDNSAMGRQEREMYLGEEEHSLQATRDQFCGHFPITSRKRKRPL